MVLETREECEHFIQWLRCNPPINYKNSKRVICEAVKEEIVLDAET